MLMKLTVFLRRFDFLLYCVFGAMATAVNMVSYEILYRLSGLRNVLSVALSWFFAVTFAFFTNKYIVFRKEKGSQMRFNILNELGYFYLCRLASGVLDVAIMYIAVDILSYNHTLWKFISNLVVGLCNYLAGKFFIFSKKKVSSEEHRS